MKTTRNRPKERPRSNPAPIRTTLMELLQELSRLTLDDDVVLAVMKNIFHTHRVRMADSRAPVRLVGAQLPIASTIKSAIRLLRVRSA